jgi:tRNA pseudouridine55 synthase
MASQPRVSGPDGLLVIDKPGGMTSRAALDRALRWFPRGTRMGHTGTLDPLATGVLVACLGFATRLAEHVQRMAKTYRSTFRLGARSDTDDADGTVTPAERVSSPDRATVTDALAGFVGTLEQVPPAFSAAKVSGRRAYDLARAGRELTLTARQVEVYGIEILAYDYPLLDVEVRCGKGTYVRSLARDLGERLGCGALVETLRRTRVGPFAAEDAVTLEADAAAVRARILPPEAALAELPRLVLPAESVQRLLRGLPAEVPEGVAAGGQAAVFDAAGRLAAVANVDAPRRLLLPDKVFPRKSDTPGAG